MECNAFNIECNPASPWYEGDSTRNMLNDDNTPCKQLKPLTKKEKKVMKIIAIVVLALTVMMSFLLGLERGIGFFFNLLPLLLFGLLMPYIFIRAIIDCIKEKRQNRKNKKKNNKKHKQLELPL